MTEVTEQEPVLLERGRYALTEMPDGSWVIRRAGPLCESCQACGCGEQDELPRIPKLYVDVLTGKLQMGMKDMVKMLGKQVTGRG